MKIPVRFVSISLPVAVGATLALSGVCGRSQGAMATMYDVPVAGGFDYTITLVNSGSTSLNSFWYGWTASGNNLPSNPSNAGNSLGWANNLDGNSIEWENSAGTALAPEQSGTFTFFSADSPTAITTPPSGGSVVYVHGIDFSQGVAGDSSGVFSPTLVAAPEPSATALLAVGALGILIAGWRSVRVKQEG